MPKVCLIGAGSVTFAKNVLSDLLTYPDLGHLTLALHDIDAGRLATAEAMARWMAGQLQCDTMIEAHLQRKAALDGADYVINAIAVGGRRSAQIDFEVPARHGIRQTIADTLGIGGIFRGLRTIPVVIELGNEMAQLCPDAWLLNYTNPMTMVPRAVYTASPHKRVVGLCHSVRDTEARLARLIGVPRDECAMLTAGVNHQAWVLRFEHRGVDMYPSLSKAIDADPDLQRTVRVEMYRRLGYFPTESSEHGSEYVPWFLPREREIARFRIPIDEYLRWMEGYARTYEKTVDDLDSGRGVEICPTSELASEVVHSIETGAVRVIYGNVRNNGLIDNLPENACVEVPCVVDRAGMRPTRVGALPPQLAALNSNFLNVSELTLQAVLEGRVDHVRHAAMLDPHLAAALPLDRIDALVDDMLVAHADLLPPGIQPPRRAQTSRTPVPLWHVPARQVPDVSHCRALPLSEWRPVTQLKTSSAPALEPPCRIIDSHAHIGRWLSADGDWSQPNVSRLLSMMDAHNVHAVVNLDGRWGDELEANLDRYDRAYPGHFATFCHLDWRELLNPGFTSRLIDSVERSARAGARGVKVWKDLGLYRRDEQGRLVLPDDPRLAPVWEAIGALGLPIAIHTADPKAFFDPIDEHNERIEQLLANPTWSFADPAFPRFNRLLDAFEALVGAHPDTQFIGVHVAGNSEDLTWVERMLSTYPNLFIDISARIAELGRQPQATRRLIMRHPDRVLFGVDGVPVTGEQYSLYVRFLQSDDEYFPHDPNGSYLMGRWKIYGLGLSAELLTKIYSANAARLFPTLANDLEAPTANAYEEATHRNDGALASSGRVDTSDLP